MLLPQGRRTTAKKWDKKERTEKKGFEQRAKPSTPTQAIDARRGEEEKYRKQKEEQKKETESGPQPSYLDHSVDSYDPYGSYGELVPIIKNA